VTLCCALSNKLDDRTVFNFSAYILQEVTGLNIERGSAIAPLRTLFKRRRFINNLLIDWLID